MAAQRRSGAAQLVLLVLLVLPYGIAAKYGSKKEPIAGLEELALRGPGGSACSGVLQARYQGQWRTVTMKSGRSFWPGLAKVVCLQVGCGSLAQVSYQPSDPGPQPSEPGPQPSEPGPQPSEPGPQPSEPGPQPGWEVKVNCHGRESNVGECRYLEPIRTREISDSRLDITCAEAVRLEGGGHSGCWGHLLLRSGDGGRGQGRGGGAWEGVCSRYLLHADQQVMCRELGCGPPSLSGWGRTPLPPAPQLVFGCRGNETRLQDCGTGSGQGGVTCEKPQYQLSCQDPSPLRLLGPAGGVGACQGLLQVRYMKEWRPLQADTWLPQHSRLLCRALRCGPPTAAGPALTQPDPRQRAWGPDRQCITERWQAKEPHLCRDWEDTPTGWAVRVNCSEPEGPVWPRGSGAESTVRLTPQGAEPCEGLVEVRVGGAWGAVCEGVGERSGRVLCRELGCSFYSYTSVVWVQTAGPIWALHHSCHGNESSHAHCNTTPPSNTCSDESHLINLVCTDRLWAPSMTLSSTIAVVGGDGSGDNHEVFGGHAFIISCHTHVDYTLQTFRLQAASQWFLPAANGSAHFLFPAAGRSHRGVYGCSYSVEEAPGIYHHEAYHTITVKDLRDVRLVGGASRCEGELEVQHQDQWRPISSQRWSEQEGGVACRQLGCGALVHTGQAPPPTWPRDVWHFLSDCGGAESVLTECGVVRPMKTTDAPVLVVCSDILLRANISVSTLEGPLGGGGALLRGRSFTVTCSAAPQYPGGNFTLLFTGHTDGTAHTRPALNHTARFLFPAASPAHRGNYTCVYAVLVHSEALTSQSPALFVPFWKYVDEVRLAWGPSPCHGTLMLSHQDSWEPLDSESWTGGWGLKHAAIVCRYLGCGSALSTRRLSGAQRRPAWRFFSDCRGAEAALLECGTVTSWPSAGSLVVHCEGPQRREEDSEEDYGEEDYGEEEYQEEEEEPVANSTRPRER